MLKYVRRVISPRWRRRQNEGAPVRQSRSLAFSLLLMLAAQSALAQEEAPAVLMKRVSDEVIAEIRKDKAIRAGDGTKIAALVDAKIVPHFDFRRITQIAMGANWRRANPEQQERLTREFRTLLVRTYSSALAGYRDQVIELRPLRPGGCEGAVMGK